MRIREWFARWTQQKRLAAAKKTIERTTILLGLPEYRDLETRNLLIRTRWRALRALERHEHENAQGIYDASR